MDPKRLKTLRDTSRQDEENSLIGESEIALATLPNKEEATKSFVRWSEEEAERYIPDVVEEPDFEEIERLSKDIDF